MMPPSEMKLVEDNKCYSPIEISSPSFTQPSLCQMELSPRNRKLPSLMETDLKSTSVGDSTLQTGALMDPTVDTNISVPNISDKAIAKSLVTAKVERI